MSITLTVLPPQIAFSRNPIPIAITSDNYIATPGVPATVQIMFKTAISAGATIPLMWAGANITMTAASSPDDSGYQFLPGNGNAAYVQSLLPIFQDNPYIDQDFDVTYAVYLGYPTIILTAKKAGVLYNIVANESSQVKINTGTLGINLDLQPNFAHHLEIWVKAALGFTRVYSNNLQLEPNSGVTNKDISDILHPYLNEVSDKPDLNTTTWQACVNTLKEYYLKISQYYGSTPVLKKVSRSGHYFVNNGGLDVQTAYGQSLQAYLRPGNANDQTLCLRQGSKLKYVRDDQPEYLYWINLTGVDVDIKIRTEIIFDDGNSTIFYSIPTTALSWNKYYLPTGYNISVKNQLPAGKRCVSYTKRIMSADGFYLSAVYTYIIDKHRDWPRYFIYRNSLGGFQTLYTWGKAQKETERTKQDIKKQATYSDAATIGAFAESNIRIQHKYTVYTGYTTQRDLQLLDDFLLSTEKYLVNKGRLIPIGIGTDSIKYPEDGDSLNGVSFEFNPLYDEVVFTDDASQPDAPAHAGSGSNQIYITNTDDKLVVTPDGLKIFITEN